MESWAQRSGDLELRLLSPDLGSLRWTWPPAPLLPEAQILLFDGGALLGWSEPQGMESPLDPGGATLAPLKQLGVSFMAAFLTGEGIEEFLQINNFWEDRHGRAEEGLLGGMPARLRRSGTKARSLIWMTAQGRLDCRWETQLGGRRIRLDIHLEEGGKIRLVTRRPKNMDWEPQDLFFQ